MDAVLIFFAAAVGWFTYVCLRVLNYVAQFAVYPRSFGRVTNVSLADLAGLAAAEGEELPCFNIVVPAYREALVIDGTIRRLAALNYPLTHVNAFVVTYADEPVEPGAESTSDVAQRAADEVNAAAGRSLVTVLSVPAGFDGEFPGNLDAPRAMIGKPRGLNFAIRRIHEANERAERLLCLGRMARLGHLQRQENVVARLEAAARDALPGLVGLHFAPDLSGFVGPCARSDLLHRLAGILRRLAADDAAAAGLVRYIADEAPRFFLSLRGEAPGERHLSPRPDRRFLHAEMAAVEAMPAGDVTSAAAALEARLASERPALFARLDAASTGEDIYQAARACGVRWLAVYDADADVPVDLFRHLAARILTDRDVMGFQGPVSPVANYDDVHALCRLGGLWMGFWHSTGYPRLLDRPDWAHVLAGTNWCFRIDGFARGDRLVRDVPHDEARRHFILSFDPRQLTEDLEVAVRIFSDWRVNAEWHPYVEYEQVPPRPSDMIVQRRRWTLGTLRTVRYMLQSRLPFLQKLKYALLPLDIVVSGTGPLITIVLWILVYTGDMLSNPVLMVWSLVLTAANVVYVMPYLMAHERFVIALRRALGTERFLRDGPDIAARLEARVDGGRLRRTEARLLHDIAGIARRGMRRGGFLELYLQGRCLDDPCRGDGTGALLGRTPTALPAAALPELVARFRELAAACDQIAESTAGDSVANDLAGLKDALQQAGSGGPWARKRRSERRQIWLWALVYLFFQLIPYYSGLFHWLRPRRETAWNKTPRTRKS